jgi:hypothetical protein
MSTWTIININIIMVGFWIVTYALIGKWRMKRVEAKLPVDPPTVCPKCGNSEETQAPTPTGYQRPIFHKPFHYSRTSFFSVPEHLSYQCWSCSHKVKIRVKPQCCERDHNHDGDCDKHPAKV